MTDLTSLTETTTPASTDIAYTVTDPSGAKNPRKTTWGNVCALFKSIAEILTNKTISLDDNTVKQGTPAAGQYARDNGTKFVGSAIQAADLPTAIDAAKLADGSVSNAEFQRLDGVSSGIQGQIDAKAPIASPTFTGTVTAPKINMTGRFSLVKGADVASANDLALGTDGNFFHITGTTTINTIQVTNWQSGSTVILYFDGALTVTHNSGGTHDILLQSGTNKTTSAGNVLQLTYDGTDWIETGGGSGGGSDTPWTVNHDFDTKYFDMEVQSAPSDPSTDNVRFYAKTIDSNNVGIFCKVKKAGAFVELQVL